MAQAGRTRSASPPAPAQDTSGYWEMIRNALFTIPGQIGNIPGQVVNPVIQAFGGPPGVIPQRDTQPIPAQSVQGRFPEQAVPFTPTVPMQGYPAAEMASALATPRPAAPIVSRPAQAPAQLPPDTPFTPFGDMPDMPPGTQVPGMQNFTVPVAQAAPAYAPTDNRVLVPGPQGGSGGNDQGGGFWNSVGNAFKTFGQGAVNFLRSPQFQEGLGVTGMAFSNNDAEYQANLRNANMGQARQSGAAIQSMLPGQHGQPGSVGGTGGMSSPFSLSEAVLNPAALASLNPRFVQDAISTGRDLAATETGWYSAETGRMQAETEQGRAPFQNLRDYWAAYADTPEAAETSFKRSLLVIKAQRAATPTWEPVNKDYGDRTTFYTQNRYTGELREVASVANRDAASKRDAETRSRRLTDMKNAFEAAADITGLKALQTAMGQIGGQVTPEYTAAQQATSHLAQLIMQENLLSGEDDAQFNAKIQDALKQLQPVASGETGAKSALDAFRKGLQLTQ